MLQLFSIIVITLAILNTCCSAPYKTQSFSQRDDWHEDRKNLNNYNFEDQPLNNCGQQSHQHHQQYNDNNEFNGYLNPQQYPSYNLLFNRLFQTPQDLHHRPEYYPKNKHLTEFNTESIRNDVYADATEEEEVTKEILSPARTILDAPKNCKQYNFKGKCIRY